MTSSVPAIGDTRASLDLEAPSSGVDFGKGSPGTPVSRNKIRTELLQGTLDLLILRTLSSATLHGWDIAKRVNTVSNERLSLKQGSLYPALHRLEARGWIQAERGVSATGRSAIFYRLTDTGRRELEAEKTHWLSFASAVASVLNMEQPLASEPDAVTDRIDPIEESQAPNNTEPI